MKILVTGKNGQLGSELQDLTHLAKNITFIFTSSVNLDVTNETAIQTLFKQEKFDGVINCAAYTAVDQAEDEPEKAFLVNKTAVGYLVKACEKHEAFLIHYSTDYVFNGIHHKPYLETHEPQPIGIYGQSKRAGEHLIINSNINALIIRTSWVYSKHGNNFVKTMIRLSKEKDVLNVINDQIGSPTHAKDLALTTLNILEQANKIKGREIYHYTNEGVCSWYDFAKAIFEINHIECQVNPIPTEQYPTKAKRPYYTVMNKEKIKHVFAIKIPHWKDTLKTLNNL